MKQIFARCPCCGWAHRAIAVHGDRQTENIETGHDKGWVWENVVTSAGRGAIANEPTNVDDESVGQRILHTFAERARRFLEWLDENP